MFENLNVWEIGGLLLLALLIFGDRLPNVISDGLRMLRNLRRMANTAASDLSKELGTDIQLEDLHPKTFIRKHLLSEEDEEAITKPVRGMMRDLKSDLSGMESELKDVADNIKSRPNGRPAGTGASTSAVGTGPAASASGSSAPGTGAADRAAGYDDVT